METTAWPWRGAGIGVFAFVRGAWGSQSMSNRWSHRLIGAVAAALTLCAAASASAKSRIKDIVEFEGVRENMLVGYGIVVGLNGSGDSLRNSPMTKQSLEAMLERLGVNVRDANMNTKNVAAVMVTAAARLCRGGVAGGRHRLGHGRRQEPARGNPAGHPLMGADGQAYAVAQGTVQTGSVSARGASGSSVTKGVPAAGRMAAGAIVERETGFQLAALAEDARAFEARRPGEAAARMDETARLANLYRHESARIKADPSLISGCADATHLRLLRATEAFDAVLARHARALTAARQ